MDTLDQYSILELEANDWLSFASAHSYEPATKAKFKTIRDRIMSLFNDWRFAAVKRAKTADLPATIKLVSERTLQYIADMRERDQAEREKVKKELARRLQQASFDLLASRVWSHRESYISSFENRADGIRDWDCLIACIESGTITEDQLPEYGIQL